MKKNKMMRAASALLVAVLLTTCVISGTYAKYTTTATGSDSARVAKWGFESNGTIEIATLFDHGDAAVKSSNTDKVIAPGTEHEVEFSFVYDATSNGIAAPEVDYTFVVDVTTEGTTTNLDANDNFHWTLDGTPYDTLALLEGAIEELALDTDGDTTYKAGTLPAAFTNATTKHSIGWVWDFDDETDTLDTQMGNADVLENVKITITITATQLN